MASHYDNVRHLLTRLAIAGGVLASRQFYGGELEVATKADGSKVTSIDTAVSNYIVNAARAANINVLSEEEGGTADYGQNGVIIVDPIDGTTSLVEGHSLMPRFANSAISLGYWDNGPVAGSVTFPFLGIPQITYEAAKGDGARCASSGDVVPLSVDTTPTRGIVFVSSKNHTPEAQALESALRDLGYTPVSEHTLVFKACCLVDKRLLRYSAGASYSSDVSVVGVVSKNAGLYDVAAAACIINAAGGVVSMPVNRSGTQLWVAANNQAVYDDLIQLVTWL